MIIEQMHARIANIWSNGDECFNDPGVFEEKINALQLHYKALNKIGRFEFINAMPHYIDVEYPVEYLRYCLMLPNHTDSNHF